MRGAGIFARVDIEFCNDDLDYFLKEMPRDYYTDLDISFLTGYQFYLDSLCQKCGVPSWYGHSTNPDVEFEIHRTVCYACRELEGFAEKKRKSDDTTEDHGATPYAKVVNPIEYPDESIEWLPDPMELLRTVE